MAVHMSLLSIVVVFSLWYYTSLCVSKLSDTLITKVSSHDTVELFPYLIRHHIMKAYGGRGVEAALIFNPNLRLQ